MDIICDIPSEVFISREHVISGDRPSDMYRDVNINLNLNEMLKHCGVTPDSKIGDLDSNGKNIIMDFIRIFSELVPFMRKSYALNEEGNVALSMLNESPYYESGVYGQTLAEITKDFIDDMFNRNANKNRSIFGTTTSNVNVSRIGAYMQDPGSPLFEKYLTPAQLVDILKKTKEQVPMWTYKDVSAEGTPTYVNIPENASIEVTLKFFDSDSTASEYHVMRIRMTQDSEALGTTETANIPRVRLALGEVGQFSPGDTDHKYEIADTDLPMVYSDRVIGLRQNSFPYIKYGDMETDGKHKGKTRLIGVYFDDDDQLIREESLFEGGPGYDGPMYVYKEDMVEDPLGWYTGENIRSAMTFKMNSDDYVKYLKDVLGVKIDETQSAVDVISRADGNTICTEVDTTTGSSVFNARAWLEKYIKPTVIDKTRRTVDHLPRELLDEIKKETFGFVSSTRSAYLIKSPGTYKLMEDLIVGHHVQGDNETGKTITRKKIDEETKVETEEKIGATINHGQILGLSPFHLGAWSLMSVHASGVRIDLNGHEMATTFKYAEYQRFYALIQLNVSPFPPPQGGFNLPMKDLRDVEIYDSCHDSSDPISCGNGGQLGYTSHHHIHGNNVTRLYIHDLHFATYEVSSITVNKSEAVAVRNCTFEGATNNIAASRYWGAWRDTATLFRRIQRTYAKCDPTRVGDSTDPMLLERNDVPHPLISEKDLLVCFGYLNVSSVREEEQEEGDNKKVHVKTYEDHVHNFTGNTLSGPGDGQPDAQAPFCIKVSGTFSQGSQEESVTSDATHGVWMENLKIVNTHPVKPNTEIGIAVLDKEKMDDRFSSVTPLYRDLVEKPGAGALFDAFGYAFVMNWLFSTKGSLSNWTVRQPQYYPKKTTTSNIDDVAFSLFETAAGDNFPRVYEKEDEKTKILYPVYELTGGEIINTEEDVFTDDSQLNIASKKKYTFDHTDYFKHRLSQGSEIRGTIGNAFNQMQKAQLAYTKISFREQGGHRTFDGALATLYEWFGADNPWLMPDAYIGVKEFEEYKSSSTTGETVIVPKSFKNAEDLRAVPIVDRDFRGHTHKGLFGVRVENARECVIQNIEISGLTCNAPREERSRVVYDALRKPGDVEIAGTATDLPSVPLKTYPTVTKLIYDKNKGDTHADNAKYNKVRERIRPKLGDDVKPALLYVDLKSVDNENHSYTPNVGMIAHMFTPNPSGFLPPTNPGDYDHGIVDDALYSKRSQTVGIGISSVDGIVIKNAKISNLKSLNNQVLGIAVQNESKNVVISDLEVSEFRAGDQFFGDSGTFPASNLELSEVEKDGNGKDVQTFKYVPNTALILTNGFGKPATKALHLDPTVVENISVKNIGTMAEWDKPGKIIDARLAKMETAVTNFESDQNAVTTAVNKIFETTSTS